MSVMAAISPKTGKSALGGGKYQTGTYEYEVCIFYFLV
jgi:hypothetical protein